MYGPEDTKEEMQVESGHNSHVYKIAVALKDCIQWHSAKKMRFIDIKMYTNMNRYRSNDKDNVTSFLNFGTPGYIGHCQGQSAGPVDKDQPPNPIKRIICDPGTRQFEGQNIGLFYTVLSRATTLGDNETCPEHEKYKNLVIYFIGSNMNKSRITNITRQQNGKIQQCCQKRTLGLFPQRSRNYLHATAVYH